MADHPTARQLRSPEHRTPRQLRADETRKRLISAAADLFKRKGYHQTWVEDIVREAGVAKGTFFCHFATKDAIAGELIAIQVANAQKARARALESGGTPIDALRAGVLALGEQAGRSRELCRALLAATLQDPGASDRAEAVFGELGGEMVDDVRAAQRAGLLPARPHAEAIARALMVSYLGTAFYFSHSQEQSLLAILRPILDVTLDGFSTPEGGGHAHRPRARQSRRPRRSP
jgi:AcrR family transcriptional regulator